MEIFHIAKHYRPRKPSTQTGCTERCLYSILNTLEDAIKNLEKGKDLESAGNQDIAFGNDNEQWMATAYALKARYLLHQLAVTEDKTALLTEVKKAAEKQ